MTLEKTIETLTTALANDLLLALRSASLSELTESTRTATIPIKRRGGGIEHIARDVLALTGLLAARPGLRAEQIRAHLRWDKRTTTKAITMALGGKRICKKGQKRATTYYVA